MKKTVQQIFGVILFVVCFLGMGSCVHSGQKFDSGGRIETVMLPGKVPLEMVWVPAGSFSMGSYRDEQDGYAEETPQRRVTLSRGFWMGKYEVTKKQWRAVMGTMPWRGKKYVCDDEQSPVVYISWEDTQAFIQRLNTLTGLTFRLPSEAEWEYSCRAGSSTRFYWGDDPGFVDIDTYAWWKGTVLITGDKSARRVGRKMPNNWGLYDMAGNVFEWCQDWYGIYPEGSVTDPTGPSVGKRRVNRGGSWIQIGGSCRSARRGQDEPSSTYDDLGFRLAR